MSIVRDAGYTVTTRVPFIEVQDQQLRADIASHEWRSTGAAGYASMLPGFMTFMAALLTRRRMAPRVTRTSI